MRGLFLGAVLFAAVVIFGCSSGPKNRVTDPAASTVSTGMPAGLTHNPDSTGIDSTGEDRDSSDIDRDSTENDSLRAFFGKISNLDMHAGTFTLTSPSGRVMEITTNAQTRVRDDDSVTNFANSPLKNGEFVSARGTPNGTPGHPSILAKWIVLNNRLGNRMLENED